MNPEDIKSLIGTVIVLSFLAYIIKRRYDLKEKQSPPPPDIYDPDDYDRR